MSPERFAEIRATPASAEVVEELLLEVASLQLALAAVVRRGSPRRFEVEIIALTWDRDRAADVITVRGPVDQDLSRLLFGPAVLEVTRG